jgi:hypothetical protein
MPYNVPGPPDVFSIASTVTPRPAASHAPRQDAGHAGYANRNNLTRVNTLPLSVATNPPTLTKPLILLYGGERGIRTSQFRTPIKGNLTETPE